MNKEIRIRNHRKNSLYSLANVNTHVQREFNTNTHVTNIQNKRN